MNLPVAQSQLPAHLLALTQNTALMGMNQAAAAGIQAGGWPRISLKSARFRLITPQGEEFLVPNLHLDVIIVDANPNGVSKIFYAKAWDPNGEGEAPDCFSDNGIGPSSQAEKPQCGTCAACPQNVWGSKISQTSGKPIKACTDTKKLAVLIGDNTSGPVFELRIPADSLKELAQYIKSLDKHGVPASSVITRLTFDPNASYPRLLFAPAFDANGTMPYINAEQVKDVLEVIGTEEVDQCTGKNDKPIDPAKVIAPAAPTAAALPAPLPPMAPPPLVPPRLAAFNQQAMGAAVAQMAQAAQSPLPDAPQAAVPKATRTRKAKVENAAAPIAPSTLPPFLADVPAAQNLAANAVNAVAPLTPVGVTNGVLDAMLAKALAV